ncbi:MAG TPA: TIR domain-containing protein [Rubrivivax sp.]|nr:TIR domain-containing protein [Rubrivivax sp.]
MRAFICWSESRSGDLAARLASWLPGVCGPELDCVISTQFQAGVPWLQQLLRELDAADAAIICLTPENLRSAWMHFEAGMVFRGGQDRVLPYFLGTKVPNIAGPLSISQAKTATLDGTLQLVQALALAGHLDAVEVQARFDARWPELNRFLRSIAAPRLSELIPEIDSLFQRKTFDEPLDQCTDQGWIARCDGARDTLLAIERRAAGVENCCQPWQVWLYRKLQSQLDGYVRDLREHLLVERRFAVAGAAKVDFGQALELPAPRPAAAIAATCLRRCREIRHVVFCLTKPQGAPRLDDALRFAQLGIDQFDDKKRLLQSKGVPVDRTALGIEAQDDLEACANSMWDFDRIIYYRVRASEPVSPDRMVQCVENELHQVEADGPGASKMPLHYAVKAWLSAVEKAPLQRSGVMAERVANEVQLLLDRTAKPDDDDPKIRANLAEIRKRFRRSASGRTVPT